MEYKRCKCCGAEVGGYIKRAGHGVLLENLCRKCWLSGVDEKIAGIPYTPEVKGYVSVKKGRS